MKHIKDLCVVTGTYQKGSELKKRWQTIGALMETDKGQFILIDPLYNLAALPREEGRDRVMVSLFDPKERDGAPKQTAHDVAKTNGYQAQARELSDEIPF